MLDRISEKINNKIERKLRKSLAVELEEDHLLDRVRDIQNVIDYMQVRIDDLYAMADMLNRVTMVIGDVNDRAKDMQNVQNYIQLRVDGLAEDSRQMKSEVKKTATILRTLYSFSTNISDMEVYKESELYKYFKNVHDMLQVHKISSNPKTKMMRVGRHHDGGYVMAFPFSSTRIAYSFGISDDVSWDMEMVDRGYHIYQYDHTIDALPADNEYFHWKKTGLGKDGEGNVKSLKSILKENQHDMLSGMVLKMDIEGCEWEAISGCDEKDLNRFDQIVIELHGLTETGNNEIILSTLRKLCTTHAAIHVHGNNFDTAIRCGDMIIPNVLEVTLLNRNSYDMEKDSCVLPMLIDQPNSKDLDDLWLGKW